MFLLEPAHLGCPGQNPESHKTVVVSSSGGGGSGSSSSSSSSSSSYHITYKLCLITWRTLYTNQYPYLSELRVTVDYFPFRSLCYHYYYNCLMAYF